MKSVSTPLKPYRVHGLHLNTLYCGLIDDNLGRELLLEIGDYRDITADHLHEEVVSNGS